MDIPLHCSCSLIKFHPAGLLAIDKAAGVLSHPNKAKANQNALLTVEYDPDNEVYYSGNMRWFLLNRLDAPTSGVILLATDEEVAAAAKKEFANHCVMKSYLAVVKGIPPRKNETWRDFLEVTRKSGQLRTRVSPGKPNAITSVLMKERGNGPPARSLIELNPVTGRTHQLRVQCATRKLPIIGDATYGDFNLNKVFRSKTGSSRLLLHSWQTSIEVKGKKTTVSFSAESPMPEIFAIALA